MSSPKPRVAGIIDETIPFSPRTFPAMSYGGTMIRLPRRSAAALFVSLAAIAMLVVSLPAHASGLWYSAMSESDSFRNATETRVLKHSVQDRAEGTRLRLELKIEQGEAVVTLGDPAGTTRFQRTFRAGKVSTEETFRGPHGEWQVRVDFKSATGRYSIKLVDF
jgi:hypothetical protein